MMSQAYVKLRSLVQLIFRPDCLYHQPSETIDHGKEEHQERQDKEHKQDDDDDDDDETMATPNGTSTPVENGVSMTTTMTSSASRGAAEDHVVIVRRNSSLKTRLLSDCAAPPGGGPTATKQVVQNIYRKPMSRIRSNQSLRHFRGGPAGSGVDNSNSQRLSRHFQLFDSDPGDIHYRYSPAAQTGSDRDRPGSQGSSTEDDPSYAASAAQGSTGYRRRVYTMPSVPTTRGPGAQRLHTRIR